MTGRLRSQPSSQTPKRQTYSHLRSNTDAVRVIHKRSRPKHATDACRPARRLTAICAERSKRSRGYNEPTRHHSEHANKKVSLHGASPRDGKSQGNEMVCKRIDAHCFTWMPEALVPPAEKTVTCNKQKMGGKSACNNPEVNYYKLHLTKHVDIYFVNILLPNQSEIFEIFGDFSYKFFESK